MQPQPLFPAGEQEWVQLQMFALQRTGDRFKARLLPATARLNVPEYFIAADKTGVLHHQAPSARFGPEHEGRVAVASPGDGYRSAWQIVFDEAVLSEDAGWIGFRCLATD